MFSPTQGVLEVSSCDPDEGKMRDVGRFFIFEMGLLFNVLPRYDSLWSPNRSFFHETANKTGKTLAVPSDGLRLGANSAAPWWFLSFRGRKAATVFVCFVGWGGGWSEDSIAQSFVITFYCMCFVHFV